MELGPVYVMSVSVSPSHLVQLGAGQSGAGPSLGVEQSEQGVIGGGLSPPAQNLRDELVLRNTQQERQSKALTGQTVGTM